MARPLLLLGVPALAWVMLPSPRLSGGLSGRVSPRLAGAVSESQSRVALQGWTLVFTFAVLQVPGSKQASSRAHPETPWLQDPCAGLVSLPLIACRTRDPSLPALCVPAAAA